MNRNTILITGGAGFIGSHVNKMLKQAGYSTVVLDNLFHGSQETLTDTPFIKENIGSSKILDQLFTDYQFQAVMHFAAFIDVGESVVNPAKYYLNNVCNTLTLLNAMVKYEVKSLVFSSSAAIFGLPQHIPISENHPCQPINPYGESKLIIEKILRDFDQAYGLKSCCLRYFNAAGGDPEGKIKYHQTHITNLIPLILRQIKTGKGILTIFGTDYPTFDGTCVRDYIHIEDLGTAHIKSMEHLLNGFPSAQYNLGNGQGFSVKEVLEAVEKVTKIKVNVTEGDRRPGDPAILIANSSKAIQELDWKPQYPDLETMIKHAWNAWQK